MVVVLIAPESVFVTFIIMVFVIVVEYGSGQGHRVAIMDRFDRCRLVVFGMAR